ncbi:MAG: hypothetical protein ACT4PM_01435 [Gemmatimonadales bacterium]
MIALFALLLQTAPAGPSVGDTVWIERALGPMPRVVVRPQAWPLQPIGNQLGPAEVSYHVLGAVVRYPVVLWYPGDRVLTMPGPVVVRPDGTSDTLPPSTHRVRLSSVLPSGAVKSRLPPRPPTTPVALGARSPVPLLVLLVAVLLGASGAALLWRRRGTVPPTPEIPLGPEPNPEMLRRWVAAGEYRTALAAWAYRIAYRLRQSDDLAEMAELQRVGDAIASLEFAPARPGHLAALAARVMTLEGGAR